MTASLSIGEYSRATYLSVKTLRHYHEVGLLEPAHVDPSSGYRYYRPDQIGTAPIARSGDAGRAHEGRVGRDRSAHLKDMEEQLEPTAAAVTAPRTLLEEPAGAAAISYRTAAATWALMISAVVTLDELIRWWTAAFDELSADTAERKQKPLRLPRRAEAFHHPFPDPGRLMGVLDLVVEVLRAAVGHRRQQLAVQ